MVAIDVTGLSAQNPQSRIGFEDLLIDRLQVIVDAMVVGLHRQVGDEDDVVKVFVQIAQVIGRDAFAEVDRLATGEQQFVVDVHQAEFVDFVHGQIQHEHTVVGDRFRGLDPFGIEDDFLLDQKADEMFLRGRDRIGLPQNPQFLEQRNEHVVKNLAETFVGQQTVVGAQKMRLVEIDRRHLEGVDGMDIGVFSRSNFLDELRDFLGRKLRDLRNLISVIVQQSDVQQFLQAR